MTKQLKQFPKNVQKNKKEGKTKQQKNIINKEDKRSRI